MFIKMHIVQTNAALSYINHIQIVHQCMHYMRVIWEPNEILIWHEEKYYLLSECEKIKITVKITYDFIFSENNPES